MTWVNRLVVLATSLLGFLACDARADEAETRRAIQRLIEVGWSTSPSARAAVDAAFVEESATIAGDQRALEAWTLILIQQRRYEEASKRVDQWIAKDRDDWFAWRARIWLWTILKNYPAAMLSAEKLAEKIAATEATSPGQQEQLDEQTAFLGRIYGFLGGPAGSSVSQEDRRSSEKRVGDRLGEQRTEMFAEARDGVLQQHLELTDMKTEQRDKARDAEVAEREKMLADIAAEREQMATRAGEIKELREKLREEMSSELNELEKQDRPLAQQHVQVEARGVLVNRELNTLLVQVDRLEFDASREQDPARRNQLLRDADRLRILASRRDVELRSLQREAAVVQRERAALAGKLREIHNNYGGQINGLDRELQGFAKREKRLTADESRAKKPISGTTGQVLSLGAQAAALSTYDTLPLEAAKEAVLADVM